MSEKCKEKVWSENGWRMRRCSRNAVKDGYCNQHHPDAIKARRKKSEERYNEKLEQSPWRRLEKASDRINKLESELARWNAWAAELGLPIPEPEESK